MRLLTILFLVTLSTQAFAQKHMLSGGSGTGYSDSNQSGNNNSNLYLNAGYQYHYMDHIQLGMDSSLFLSSDFKRISLAPIVTYNLDKEIKTSYYVSASVGLNYNVIDYTDSTNSSTTLEAKFGKRFKLAENVTYTPEVYLSSTSGSDTVYYGFSFFKLSIFL
jgi:hypothetical protein